MPRAGVDAMTARATWKGAERRIAADLGGARIPVTGIDRDGADVVTPMFHVQVKLRKALPAWLWAWLAGIRSDATPAGKVGVLILKKPRQDDREGLVVMSYGDFVELHGRPAAYSGLSPVFPPLQSPSIREAQGSKADPLSAEGKTK